MGRATRFELLGDRLVVRALARADITTFTRYRNEPAIARYQDWEIPYTRDLAHALLDEQDAFDGPTPGVWVQLAIERHDGDLLGDLAVWLDATGALAMVGYTLAPEHHGHGYATEALGVLVDHLVDDVGVHRVAATLDPANIASARVLERVGFRYEGRSVGAAPVRGVWLDDDRYAVLADERREWRDRPRGRVESVELIEITSANQRAVQRLVTHHSQERLVSPVVASFADALFPDIENGAPVVPWMRAVRADGHLAGFVMLTEVTPAHPVPYLWRLLVDRWWQGRGVGSAVLAQVVDRLRAEGHTTLEVSYHDGPGGPAAFYARHGFVPTGEIDQGEIVARRPLPPPVLSA